MNEDDKNSKELRSHHIFLFPFMWISNGNGEPLAQQVALERVDHFFAKEPRWKDDYYTINTPVKYNEYNYFYDFVREVLYDTYTNEKEKSPLYTEESGAQQMLRHYHYDWGEGDAFYIFQANDPNNSQKRKKYCLEIDSILLQLYYTGVGILSFHLNNRREDQSSPEDILWINQFGRRLYPPFFSLPQKQVGTPNLDIYDQFKDNLPLGLELAHYIELRFPSGSLGKYSWRDYREYDNFKGNPFLLPDFIGRILPQGFVSSSNNGYKIVPALDDRMFVVSWYGNDGLAIRMYSPPNITSNSPASLAYLRDEWWYKYVFVDAGLMTCQNEFLQEQVIEQATNSRWVKFGTVFGVSNYSFVLLTGALPTLRKNNAAFLVTHLQTMYYKLAELVLLQRASVQRFSDEVTHISRLDGENEQLAERVGSLYRQYIRFVNKIYFREVTAQGQGDELYQLMQRQCRLEKQVKDLDEEINELHNYVLQVTEQDRLKEEKKLVQIETKRNERLEWITILGAVFLLPSLVLGIYGVSVLPSLERPCLLWVMGFLAVLLVLVAGCAWWAFNTESRSRKITLAFVMGGALLSPVFIMSLSNCQAPPSENDRQLEEIHGELKEIHTELQQWEYPVPVIIDTTKTTINGQE